MSTARDSVRMSEQEIADFLQRAHSLQLATLDQSGAPHLTTVWFVVHDGTIFFETYGKSQKTLNMRRDPRVAVLAEDGRKYGELRGVSIQGRAELIEVEPRKSELMHMLIGHHFPELTDLERHSMVERMTVKRVVVAVHPVKIMSWDHRKLGTSRP